MNRVRSRRTIARKSPAIWTIVAFVVCERIRRSRVNAVNFYWLHKLYITCYSLPHLNDDLDSCNSQQFPNEFAWFRTSNGSTRKSHLRQVLTHIVFPSQNKLDVPKLTLKSFENQPLCKRERWTSLRGRWWGFSLLLFFSFVWRTTSAKSDVVLPTSFPGFSILLGGRTLVAAGHVKKCESINCAAGVGALLDFVDWTMKYGRP